ncbi:hypothetical protein D9Q98_002389 [Chlorella vulgaris]|uniref:Uncharacterized protein n=1 Tax=Chlorella vulgaris TaxID=3077 RepID=A0A9D4Z0P7_CHLVU|nr:hypothetical protein D9Q98_002389 [Chlorella vulgaris]
MTSIGVATSPSAKQLASGLRSGGGMRSATSVPSRGRATVPLNRRMASGCGGASLFQPTAGPRGSSPRRRRGAAPPTAVPRGLDLLLEAPKRAKEWVISLDKDTWLLIVATVTFWSCISVCLYRGGDMLGDALVVFIIWKQCV